MTNPNLDRLAAALSRDAELERLKAEQAKRQWTASEVDRLIRRAAAENDPETLRAIYAAVEEAKRTGRFTDDKSPTVANVAAALPEGAWRMTNGELASFMRYAEHLAKETGNSNYRDAAYRVGKELADQGRVSAETHLGDCYKTAAPPWVHGMPARWIDKPTDANEQLHASAQEARWNSVSRSWKNLLDARIDGKEPPAWTPGASWEPSSVETYIPNASKFGNATRATARAADAIAAETAKQRLAAADQAARAGLSTEQRTALEADERRKQADAELRRSMGID